MRYSIKGSYLPNPIPKHKGSKRKFSRSFPFPLIIGWRCLAQARIGTGQSRPREAAQPPAASRVQQLQLIPAQPEPEHGSFITIMMTQWQWQWPGWWGWGASMSGPLWLVAPSWSSQYCWIQNSSLLVSVPLEKYADEKKTPFQEHNPWNLTEVSLWIWQMPAPGQDNLRP